MRIGEPSQREARKCVKQGKGEALEQTNTCVVDMKVAFHGSNKQAQDLTVDQRQRIAEHQNEDDVPCIADREWAAGIQIVQA